MQKFVTIILAVISITSNADTCKDALKNADAVISAEQNEINLMSSRITEVQDENTQLSQSIVKLKDVSDQNFSRQVEFGLVGVVLGVLAISYLKK